MRAELALVAGAIGLLCALPSFAHVAPSERENNRYILVAPLGDRVRLAYTVYMGQVPGRQARARMDANRDGRIDEDEARKYGEQVAAQSAPRLSLAVDGVPVADPVGGDRRRPRPAGDRRRRLRRRSHRMDLPRAAARAPDPPPPPARRLPPARSRRDRAARRGEPRRPHRPLAPGPRLRHSPPRLPLDRRPRPARDHRLRPRVRRRPGAGPVWRRSLRRRSLLLTAGADRGSSSSRPSSSSPPARGSSCDDACWAARSPGAPSRLLGDLGGPLGALALQKMNG